METDDDKYFDHLAAHYTDIVRGRAKYLGGVNDILVRYFRESSAKTLLDVGAGDGARTRQLVAEGGITRFIAVESNPVMSEKAKAALGEDNILQVDATRMELPPKYFDVAVCLWNVLGHIPNAQGRVETLRRIAQSMKHNGRVFVDVNNRYNISQYGWSEVSRNIWADLRRWEGRGWYPIELDGFTTKVYMHRPGEVSKYAAQSGLCIEKTIYLDYGTGYERHFPWQGQLLYVMRPE